MSKVAILIDDCAKLVTIEAIRTIETAVNNIDSVGCVDKTDECVRKRELKDLRRSLKQLRKHAADRGWTR